MIIRLECFKIGALLKNSFVGFAVAVMPIKEPFSEKLPTWQAGTVSGCRAGPVFEKCEKL